MNEETHITQNQFVKWFNNSDIALHIAIFTENRISNTNHCDMQWK